MNERRDKLGRRIGRNWWRELIVDSWFWADRAWQEQREMIGAGYSSETQTFQNENPRPTLKMFMVHLSADL